MSNPFEKKQRVITRFDIVTANKDGELLLTAKPLPETLHNIHMLTIDGSIGTTYPVHSGNGFAIKDALLSCEKSHIQAGCCYFCTYNTSEFMSQVDVIRGKVHGTHFDYIEGDSKNVKERLKILNRHMRYGLDGYKCDDVWYGRIPDRIDGCRTYWNTHNGSMVEAYGEIVYGQFLLNHKVSLSIIGDLFIVIDIRHDGKNDFWEYCSDGGPYMPGPPCVSEHSRHRLGDNRIEKYLQKLKSLNMIPTTSFCNQAENMWKRELKNRRWLEE